MGFSTSSGGILISARNHSVCLFVHLSFSTSLTLLRVWRERETCQRTTAEGKSEAHSLLLNSFPRFLWMNLCNDGTTSFTASSATCALPSGSSASTHAIWWRSVTSSSRSKKRLNFSFTALLPLSFSSMSVCRSGEKFASK